MTKFSF